MNILKINLLLSFTLLFASCAQNRSYTLNKLDNNTYQTENFDSSESQPDRTTNLETELSHNNEFEEDSDNISASQKTTLVEYLNESDEVINVQQITLVNQNSTTEVAGLTLSELETIALNNHPEIQQSLADVSSMKGQRFQVTRKNNPVVGYQAQEVGNDGEAGQQGLFINQTFITADKLCLNDQIAAHLVQKKNWEWQVKELEILNNVRRNFYDYRGAVSKLKLTYELLSISEESVITVQKLIKAGDAKKSQQLQADILNKRNAIAVNSQEQYVKASYRKLMVSVGTPGMNHETVQRSLHESFPTYEWDLLYNTMIQSHPSIQAAKSQVQSANWAIRRAEVQKVPDIQTQLGVMYDTSTLDTVVGIQIGGALPFHDQNKGNIRSRHAEYMKAIQEVERVKLSLTSQLADAYQSYESQRVQTFEFKESILPKAKESLNLISRGFKQRQDTYTQLLIAQKIYFESNQEYVDILIQMNQTFADLQKLKSID